jgi:hypothetical protein
MDNSIGAFVLRYVALGLTGTPATTREIEAVERQLGVVFPAAYKAFLLILGCDGGPDFAGSDCTIRALPNLRTAAQQLLRSKGASFHLPDKAVVFLMHQGYSFAFFVADGSTEDPPVFAYLEGEAAPSQKAKSFSAWLEL